VTHQELMDWFDPRNINHLKAYKHLQKTGVWPEGFIKGELPSHWQTMVTYKLADAYLDLMGIR